MLRRPFAIVLAVLPACSLFTSLGDFSENEGAGSSDSAADGAPIDPEKDGGNTADAAGDDPDGGGTITDGGSDAGGLPNLHPNGAFEFSCQGWYPYNATLESDPTAHGGAASCRVCANKTAQDVATIDEQGAVLDPVTGGVYYAAGWFRMTDDKSPFSDGVKLVFGSKDVNGAEVEYTQTAKIAIDKTWKKLDVQLTLTKDAKRLRVWAGGKAELGTCFLIDDVRVERRQ